jgi:hypothetical protein
MRRMTNEGTDKTAAIQDSRDHRRMIGGIETTSVELSDVLIDSSFSPKFLHWRHLVADPGKLTGDDPLLWNSLSAGNAPT